MAIESNAIQKAIASMNQYQQMGNTGAIASYSVNSGNRTSFQSCCC
ncbi:hypothetical protein [uncultured Nostoc sp.]